MLEIRDDYSQTHDEFSFLILNIQLQDYLVINKIIIKVKCPKKFLLLNESSSISSQSEADNTYH